MIKILDWYILKRYLGTFMTLFLIFIPIGIMANLAEKIDNIFETKAPLMEVLKFYGNFTSIGFRSGQYQIRSGDHQRVEGLNNRPELHFCLCQCLMISLPCFPVDPISKSRM